MDALDKHVAAGDGESPRLSDDCYVVLPRLSREVWLDPLEEAKLAEASHLHDVSIARRRRTACSGSVASATARMTHTRCNPAAVTCATFDSSMPPIANTGTVEPAPAAIAATPLGPMTCFLVLIGVANAGPLPR